MNISKDVQILLVDSNAGIYAFRNLSCNFPLFVNNDLSLSGWLLTRADFSDNINEVFNPDNIEWCENIEYLTTTESLSVKDDRGMHWRIEQSEHGDIWAINPNAEWNDDLDEWELEKVDYVENIEFENKNMALFLKEKLKFSNDEISNLCHTGTCPEKWECFSTMH